MKDFRDHDVWTNLFYVVPGVFAFTFNSFSAIAVIIAGTVLAVMSGFFHLDESNRIAQRLDVTATFGFLISLPAALLIPINKLFVLAIPVTWIVYYIIKWKVNSRYYFTGGAVIAEAVLLYMIGWYGLIPIIPMGISVLIRNKSTEPDSTYHSLFHVGTQISAVVYLLTFYFA